MGYISDQIKRKFMALKKEKVLSLEEIRNITAEAKSIFDSFRVPDRLNNYDPLHAIHISTQNLVSIFYEQIILLPELDKTRRIINNAIKHYGPSYPPISPITQSFFSLWYPHSLLIGKDKETISSIMIDLSDVLGIPHEWITMIKIQMNSRIGIYEHCGYIKDKIILKELVSDVEYVCYPSTLYMGFPGQLWFTSIMPSLFNMIDYSVCFTTPYVLRQNCKKEWLEYFTRYGITPDHSQFEEKLYTHLKFGPKDKKGKPYQYYWFEYVMDSYDGYQHDAIFLRGCPE